MMVAISLGSWEIFILHILVLGFWAWDRGAGDDFSTI